MMRLRATTVEPLFGQTKHAPGSGASPAADFAAVQAEGKLIAATSNLLELYRARVQPA